MRALIKISSKRFLFEDYNEIQMAFNYNKIYTLLDLINNPLNSR